MHNAIAIAFKFWEVALPPHNFSHKVRLKIQNYEYCGQFET